MRGDDDASAPARGSETAAEAVVRRKANRRARSSDPAPTAEVAAMETRLSAAGYRLNRPRRVLVSVLLDAQRPLEASEIRDVVQDAGGRIALSSVHRNLQLFVALGLVEVAAQTYGRRAFRLSREQPSLLMVQRDIGLVGEIDSPALVAALATAVAAQGYRLAGPVELRVVSAP